MSNQSIQHQIANQLYTYVPRLSPKSVGNPSINEQMISTNDNSIVSAGLLLWNGDLDASHTISQHIEDITGSYWHGIMHRMEPDYSNAKYWFRKVGSQRYGGTLFEGAS